MKAIFAFLLALMSACSNQDAVDWCRDVGKSMELNSQFSRGECYVEYEKGHWIPYRQITVVVQR